MLDSVNHRPLAKTRLIQPSVGHLPAHRQVPVELPVPPMICHSTVDDLKQLERAVHSMHNRTSRASQACRRCRKMKIKCDNQRPCRNCVARGLGDTCSSTEDSNTAVQKQQPKEHQISPFAAQIGFQGRIINLSKAGQVAMAVSKRELVAQQFGGGSLMPMNRAAKLVDGMPEDLIDSLIEGVAAIQLINMGEVSPVVAAEGHYGDRCASSTRLVPRAGCFVSIVDDDYSAAPLMVCDWSLSDLTMQSCAFNRSFAEEIAGVPSEELLTRLACKECHMPCSELEFICQVIDDSQTFFMVEQRTVYHVWCQGALGNGVNRGAMLVRRHTRSVLLGQVVRCSSTFEAVSPLDYDCACLICPENCRPLLDGVGDSRSGAQLIEDHAPGSKPATLLDMCNTAQGAAQLQSLALLLRTLFKAFKDIADATAAQAAHVAAAAPCTAESSHLEIASSAPSKLQIERRGNNEMLAPGLPVPSLTGHGRLGEPEEDGEEEPTGAPAQQSEASPLRSQSESWYASPEASPCLVSSPRIEECWSPFRWQQESESWPQVTVTGSGPDVTESSQLELSELRLPKAPKDSDLDERQEAIGREGEEAVRTRDQEMWREEGWRGDGDGRSQGDEEVFHGLRGDGEVFHGLCGEGAAFLGLLPGEERLEWEVAASPPEKWARGVFADPLF